MENKKLGFLGFGQMGSALGYGISKTNTIKKENIYYYVPTPKDNTFNYIGSVKELILFCDIVICAVKPNIVSCVLKDMGPYLRDKILISICGGVTIKRLEQLVGEDNKVVRVMPNTPCLIGEGSSIFCVNKNVNDSDKQCVINIFNSCGIIYEIDEKHMDIATGLIGAGPAYVYLFIESLIDAGAANGLPKDLSKNLILQTILGSTKMIKNSNLLVQQLKDNVCSPGGVTYQGLFTLEKHRFKFAIIDAVNAACEKSKTMH